MRSHKLATLLAAGTIAALIASLAPGEEAAPDTKPRIQIISIGNAGNYYPAMSLNQGEQGRPVVHLCTDRNGKLLEVSVQTSSGYPRLDAAAVKYFRDAKYRVAPEPDVTDTDSFCIDRVISFALKMASDDLPTRLNSATLQLDYTPDMKEFFPADRSYAQVDATVELRICVNGEGVLYEGPSVTQSTGYPELDQAAIKYVKALRFKKLNPEESGNAFQGPIRHICGLFPVHFEPRGSTTAG